VAEVTHADTKDFLHNGDSLGFQVVVGANGLFDLLFGLSLGSNLQSAISILHKCVQSWK
jgi:hypothetical protein